MKKMIFAATLLILTAALTGCGSTPRKAAPCVIHSAVSLAVSQTAAEEAPTQAAEADVQAPAETAPAEEAAAPAPGQADDIAAPGQDPIMDYIGRYSDDKANMTVAYRDDGTTIILVAMDTEDGNTSFWTMSGKAAVMGDKVVVRYQDCVKETYCYAEDGTLVSKTTDYADGTGSVSFNIYECGAAWADAQEGIADGRVFDYPEE